MYCILANTNLNHSLYNVKMTLCVKGIYSLSYYEECKFDLIRAERLFTKKSGVVSLINSPAGSTEQVSARLNHGEFKNERSWFLREKVNRRLTDRYKSIIIPKQVFPSLIYQVKSEGGQG